jgi:hypothetical protein
LIAVLCDALGLRRPKEKDAVRILFEQSTKAVPESRIPVGSISKLQPDIIETLVPEEFELNPRACQSIESVLTGLSKELAST